MGEQKVTKCLTAPIGKQREKTRREERYTSDRVSPPGVTQMSELTAPLINGCYMHNKDEMLPTSKIVIRM